MTNEPNAKEPSLRTAQSSPNRPSGDSTNEAKPELTDAQLASIAGGAHVEQRSPSDDDKNNNRP
jgi:hypothetical protein